MVITTNRILCKREGARALQPTLNGASHVDAGLLIPQRAPARPHVGIELENQAQEPDLKFARRRSNEEA